MPTPLAGAAFHCALCQKLACTVELLPVGHPEGLGKDKATIFLRDFIGTEKVVVTVAGISRVQAALEQADAAALYQVERLWAPFYCPTCNSIYCLDHWTVIPQYDEGYFDCSYGFCPQGHRRLLED